MEEVQFKFREWDERIQLGEEFTHDGTDGLYSLFATATATLISWNEPEMKGLDAETAKLVVRGAQVGPSTLLGWAECLKAEQGDKRPFEMVNRWLFQKTSRKLAESKTAKEVAEKAQKFLEEEFKEVPENGLLFVPLIIIGRGLFERDHVVWVAADRQTEQLEYYDSKGIALKTDRKGWVLANKDLKHRLVTGVLWALMAVTGYKEVIQNPIRHQFDIHNCGPLGMVYMDERRGKTFKKFIVRSYDNLITVRRLMAERMLVAKQSNGGPKTLMDFSLELE